MSTSSPSPLAAATKVEGARTGTLHEDEVIRNFGSPAEEYVAASEGVAVFDGSHRTRLRIRGRAPGQMLDGILTGTLPVAPAPEPAGDEGRPGEVLHGRATYHSVLTAKGKMVSDLWTWSLGADEGEDGFLLDVPGAGREGLLRHFGTFLPPRMAGVEDVSADTAMVWVTGPEAAALLSRTALGLRVEADALEALEEGEFRAVGADASEALLVTRTAQVWPTAFSVLGPRDAVGALWDALVSGGARPAGAGVWETLRVEAGRPVYGADMDEATIPVEAGIHDRAIDYQKGCYTGQEVIVRIRDRGRVNRSLTLVHLGGLPTPAAGTELFDPQWDRPERPAAVVTSAVQSPRFGETVALAYVRRDADPARLVPERPDTGD